MKVFLNKHYDWFVCDCAEVDQSLSFCIVMLIRKNHLCLLIGIFFIYLFQSNDITCLICATVEQKH